MVIQNSEWFLLAWLDFDSSLLSACAAKSSQIWLQFELPSGDQTKEILFFLGNGVFITIYSSTERPYDKKNP